MRRALAAIWVIAAVVTFTSVATKDTQAAYFPNPWCLKAVMGKGWVVDLCYFRTFEQCANERFNYGNSSFCVQNPEWVFAKAHQEEQRRARRKANQ
jgi:hypothetical protein